MDLITPAFGLIFWQTLIFLVVLFVLGKFAWKPILGALKTRENSIDEALKSAVQAKEEMANLKADNEKLLAEAKLERDKMLQAASKIADDMKRQARLALNSLALGTWLELRDEETREFQRLKLAVKFNATGRHVFVNEEGITIADFKRDELIDMLLQGKMKLLESDMHFADRL
jgi:F-type H+-transporting ATPase subunit b